MKYLTSIQNGNSRIIIIIWNVIPIEEDERGLSNVLLLERKMKAWYTFNASLKSQQKLLIKNKLIGINGANR